jgi:hypothetical protein
MQEKSTVNVSFGITPSEFDGFVESELLSAPGRLERLGRFFDECCQYADPTESDPLVYTRVLASYRAWCRARQELCHPRELKLILRSHGCCVIRRYVTGIVMKEWAETESADSAESEGAWYPLSRLVRAGFSRLGLQALREAGCKPVWRVRGREIQYDAAAFQAWLSERRFSRRDGGVEAMVGRFLDSACEFRQDCWTRCSDLSQACREWCVAEAGAVPAGMRQALWREVRQRGCEHISPRVEKRQVRAVKGVLCRSGDCAIL